MKEDKQELELLEKMKINTITATILGVITVGGYWIVFLRRWLIKNQDYKELFYTKKLEEPVRRAYIEQLKKRTKKNLKLINIIGLLLAIGLTLFLIETFAELYLRKVLFDEEPFWFFVWVVFSLFAVLLASIAIQMQKTLTEESDLSLDDKTKLPWLLNDAKTKIYVLVFLNIVCALGLLPFVIFPPILGTALNGYVEREKTKI